jgi:hypothetical protein
MSGLADEFLAHSEQWDVEPALVKQMMGDVLDIERLIESLDQVCSARASLKILGGSDPAIDRLDTVRSEIEWFVQHAAERISARDAHLMWGSVLRAVKKHELTLATTNYDRAIELAANAERLRLVDGFEAFDQKETASWLGFADGSQYPRFVKLHGSTDWYAAEESGAPLKLRHPMPLFGRGMLRLSNGRNLSSALILPSREKLLTRPPYLRLSQVFFNAADACEAAVFVGSSLRDQHIRQAALDIAATRPLFVVNRSGNSFGISKAHSIAQAASFFLISTLPAALRASNPIDTLQSAISSKTATNVLHLLQQATNVHEQTHRRCEAIEQLDHLSATLDEALVGGLLTDDDPIVARYALGLVSTSPGRTMILTYALESPHATDPAFAEELALLRQMIEGEAARPAA